jgi:multidrug efflux pump subunit AcrB
LRTFPSTAQRRARRRQAAPANPEILSDLASVERGHEMEVVNHYNIRRVVDVYANVQDRDLGAVSRQIAKILDGNAKSLPRGTFVTLKGQVDTMRSSYADLLGGLVFLHCAGLPADRRQLPELD